MSGGDRAMDKLNAGLAAAAGVAGGLVYGPLAVQAAIVAALVGIAAVFGLAHAHDMTVRRAAALYGGRAILALFKAAAVALVEWPLRGSHRLWTRFDLALRLELLAVAAGHRAGGRLRVLRGRLHPVPPSADVLAASGPVLAKPTTTH